MYYLKWLPHKILGGKSVQERLNQSTNNGDMAERAKRLVSNGVSL